VSWKSTGNLLGWICRHPVHYMWLNNMIIELISVDVRQALL